MARRGSSYPAALRTTLRQTAAAYGYTLSIAASISAMTAIRGTPGEASLFLFAGGALGAFALLEGVLHIARVPPDDSPEVAFPLAGALNFLSVPAAIAAVVGVAHAVDSPLAWLIAGTMATGIYMPVVALQVSAVNHLRR